MYEILRHVINAVHRAQGKGNMPTKSTTPVVASHTVASLAIARAKQRNIEVGKAAKEVRGILRANFADVVRIDPSILEVKSSANDGNRWPALNADVRDFVLDRAKRAAMKATPDAD